MISRGFTYNGKHNYNDFGLVLTSKKISPPPKTKIKETIPFMSGAYDFSVIGSGGEQIFGERQIEIVLGLPTYQKENLHILYSSVLEWLGDVQRKELIFDDICDYYFEADLEDSPEFEELHRFGKLTLKFTAQPFKKGVSEEGTYQLWDTFNFLVDVMQDTEFSVSGTLNIDIINVGRSVYPTINCSTSMSIVCNNTTYNLSPGDNNLYDFKLSPGDNYICINSTGYIKFIFRKETL